MSSKIAAGNLKIQINMEVITLITCHYCNAPVFKTCKRSLAFSTLARLNSRVLVFRGLQQGVCMSGQTGAKMATCTQSSSSSQLEHFVWFIFFYLLSLNSSISVLIQNIFLTFFLFNYFYSAMHYIFQKSQ